jgi:hypothetical protein
LAFYHSGHGVVIEILNIDKHIGDSPMKMRLRHQVNTFRVFKNKLENGNEKD